MHTRAYTQHHGGRRPPHTGRARPKAVTHKAEGRRTQGARPKAVAHKAAGRSTQGAGPKAVAHKAERCFTQGQGLCGTLAHGRQPCTQDQTCSALHWYLQTKGRFVSHWR